MLRALCPTHFDFFVIARGPNEKHSLLAEVLHGYALFAMTSARTEEGLLGLTDTERGDLRTECADLAEYGRAALRSGFDYPASEAFRERIERRLVSVVGAGSAILKYLVEPFSAERSYAHNPSNAQTVVSRLKAVAERADAINSSLPQEVTGRPRVQAPSWFSEHRPPDFALVKGGAVLAAPLRQWAAGAGRWVLARRIRGLSGLGTVIVTVVVGVLIVVLGAVATAFVIPRLFPPPA